MSAALKSRVQFSADTQFFDVEGIPVTIGADGPGTPDLYCAAWDEKPPRKFDGVSALRNGAPISREAFERLAKLTP